MAAAVAAGTIGGPYPAVTLPISATTPAASMEGLATGEASQRILERRVDWLEEDLMVIHRRLRDSMGSASSDSAASGTLSRLKQFANQLLSELADERRWREDLELSIQQMEGSLRQEHDDRQMVLQGMASELEETMQKLVRRIETGLGEGTSALQERAGKTEAILRGLAERVETGLATGAQSLQDTLKVGSASNTSGRTPSALSPKSMTRDTSNPILSMKGLSGMAMPESAVPSGLLSGLPSGLRSGFASGLPSGLPSALPSGAPSGAPSGVPSGANTPLSTAQLSALGSGALGSRPLGSTEGSDQGEVAEPLLKVWGDLQQENIMLRKKRERLVNAQASRRRSPANTNKGRGDSISGSDLSTSQKQMTLLSDFASLRQDRDSDAISVTSSLPSSANAQAQQEAQARASAQAPAPVEPPVEKPLATSFDAPYPAASFTASPLGERRPATAITAPVDTPVYTPLYKAKSPPAGTRVLAASPQQIAKAAPKVSPLPMQQPMPSRVSAGRGHNSLPTSSLQSHTVAGQLPPGSAAVPSMRPVTVSGGIAGTPTRAVAKGASSYPTLGR